MLLFYSTDGYLLGMGIWLTLLAVTFWWGLRSRRRYRSPAARRWIHLGLSVWFFLACLTLPELWYACWIDQTDSFNSSNISQRWFRRHVHFNPQGFRDALAFTRAVPEGKQRIVFVGDSFTFGHGIEDVADRFSDRVGQELEHAMPGRFVVANLGVSGFGTNDMVPLWNQKVLQTDSQADIAIYTICLNDIEWFAKDNLQQNAQIQDLNPSFFLFRETYFYNQFFLRLQFSRRPAVRDYYGYVQDYYRGAPWDKMRDELLAFHTLLKQHHTELRLVIFPFLHNLGNHYPFRKAHERIVDFAKSQQIPILDLDPVLTPHVTEGLTVNRFDAHPNQRAHELAAEAIFQELLDDLIQPSDPKPRK
jgi:lysophospholipase L1-like esterase